MTRRTLLLTTAIGALALGSLTTGTAADAARPSTAARAVTVTPATPNVLSYPKLTVTGMIGTPTAGDIFIGPKINGVRPADAGVGPLITDALGRPVYFHNEAGNLRATDVRVQTYSGKRVLTYWAGKTGVNPGYGNGDDYIVDQHYKVLRVVHAIGTGASGKPLMADQHEFFLTPGGTALIVCYDPVRIDARPWGGAQNQLTLDNVVQEIDLKTSKVVLEWHSLDHVKPGDSYVPPTPSAPDTPWDYFHVNAVKIDKDFNLLISSRHTWAVYKVQRHTGHIIWILGGKASTFKKQPGAGFSWQHDPEPLGNNSYRIFDNAYNRVTQPPPHPRSRVITVKIDLKNKTVSPVQHIYYSGSGDPLAGSQGNSEMLPGGHLFVGWGDANHVTELNARHELIFNAHLPANYDTYRAYKSAWAGTPSWAPRAVISSPNGKRQIDAVWNGASTVDRWRILGGSSQSAMSIIGRIDWNGFDTAFHLSSYPKFVQLVAIDSQGHAIKRTAPQQVG